MAYEIYEIDFNIAAERITPPQYRKSKIQAWFKALLTPLKEFRDKIFIDYANGGTDWDGNTMAGARERIKYNARTIVFEALLNKTFGVVSAPFIYINNNQGVENEIYLNEDGDGYVPSYFGDSPNNIYTLFVGELNDYAPTYDFTVYVPIALYNSIGSSNPERTARVQSEVDKYKLIGTTNNILTY